MARTLHWRLMAAGAVASLAVVLCACSSAAKTTTALTGTASGQPLVIGNIGGYTGATGTSTDPAEATIEAWAKWTNAHGGINGRPVKLVVMDDSDNPTRALADAEQLVGQDHVIALVGDTDSGLEQVYSSYVKQQGVPVVGGDQTTTEYLTNPDFFPAASSVIADVASQAGIAKDGGATRMATVYCAEVASCGQAVPLLKEAGTALGLPIVYAAAFSASAPSYTALCLAAQQVKADAVALDGSSGPADQRVADNCAQQDYRPAWVIPGEALSSSMLSDPVLNSALVSLPGFPWFVHDTATADFHAALAAYEPHAALNATASMAWMAGVLFAEAAAHLPAGPPTAHGVVAGLRAVSGTTLGGLSNPLKFSTTGGANPADNCFFTAKISKGALTAPRGITATCLSLPGT